MPFEVNEPSDAFLKYQLETCLEEKSEGFQLIDQSSLKNDIHEDKIDLHNRKSRSGRQEAIILCKELYKQLWITAQASIQTEEQLKNESRALQQKNLEERIIVEKCKLQQDEELESISSLEQERMEAQMEADRAERTETVVHYELQRLEEVEQQMAKKLEEMKQSNAQHVGPELDRLRNLLYAMKDEQETTMSVIEKEKKFKFELDNKLQELIENQNELQLIKGKNKVTCEDMRAEFSKQKKETIPIIKNLDKLKLELAKLNDKINSYEIKILDQNEKSKKVEGAKFLMKEMLKDKQGTNDSKQSEIDEDTKSLELAKSKYHAIATENLDQQLTIKKIDEDIRHYENAAVVESKQLEMSKRVYLKKTHITKTAQELISKLKFNEKESSHMLRSLIGENEKQGKVIDEMKEEVEVGVIRFLAQESVEKGKRDDLNFAIEKIEMKESKIQHWLAEEKKMSKIIHIMSAQRVLQERESVRCSQSEKDLQEKIMLKEFVVRDLAKKVSETDTRLKDYQVLYDLIQKDRNELYGMIESSTKVLQGLKNKVKLQQNEVESLEEDISIKQKILQRERDSHEHSMTQTAALRGEYFKVRSDCSKVQHKLDSQISEIEKLNTTISSSQREMKRAFESQEYLYLGEPDDHKMLQYKFFACFQIRINNYLKITNASWNML